MDYDVIVLGGGTAGLTAALTARHFGASVALVEQRPRIGGDCTFFGCVPSKALIEVAQLAHDLRRAEAEAIVGNAPAFDFAAVMRRRARIVEEIADDERDERFTRAGIDVVHAQARFRDEHTLELDGARRISGARFVLATGSSPAVPPIDGLAAVRFLTNETVFELQRLPERLLVLGGGAVGLELGRAGGGMLVGAQIVGPRAGELIQECALAIQTRCFAGRLAQTIHAYPTMSLAVQQAEAQISPVGRTLAPTD